MKKRLLITSIVMMLVVAVALSTATYAWFTSSAQVTSTSISLTAATNSATSLGISWTDGNYGPQITAVGPTSATFQPACPETLEATTTSEVDFYTAFATPTAGGDMVFKTGSVAKTNVYTWSDGTGTGTHQSFFIKNLSPANSISTITVKAQITDTNNLVRVGIFKKDTTSGDYLLLGVLANQESTTYTAVSVGTTLDNETTYYVKRLGKYITARKGTDAQEITDGNADYIGGTTQTTAEGKTFYTAANTATNAQVAYGTVTADASVNAQTTKASTAAGVGIDITGGQGLAAQGVIELVVLVWEDAIALGDGEAETVSTVALSFDA